MRQRDENFAFAEEREAAGGKNINVGWEENHYTLKNVKDERASDIVQTSVYQNQPI